MYTMQDQETKGDESSTETLSSTAPSGLGPATWGALVRDSEHGTLAWSEYFQRYRGYGRELIAFPKLNLGHTLTLRLVARRPYHLAMAGCTLEIPADGVCAQFHIIKATFPFYRTGEAILDDVLLVLDDGTPPDLALVLKLLRIPG